MSLDMYTDQYTDQYPSIPGVVSDRALPVIQVLVDWVNNPLGSGALAGNNWTDISTYVRLDQGINLSRGRQDNISAVQPGRCTFTVHNDDGRFTPGASGSPYSPGVVVGRRVQVNVRDESGTYHTRFDGQIAEYQVVDTPTGQDTFMRIICADVLAFLNRFPGFSCQTVQECSALNPSLQYLMNEPANSAGLFDSSGNGGPQLSLFTYASPPFIAIPHGGSNAYLSAPTMGYQSGSNPVEGAVPPTSYPGNYANPVTSPVTSPLPSVQFGMTINNASGANTQAQYAPSSQFQGFLTTPVSVSGGTSFTLLGWVWPNGNVITNPYNSTTHAMICLGNSRTGSMVGLEADVSAGTATYQAAFYPSYSPYSAGRTATSGFSSGTYIIGNAPFMVAVVVNGTTATFYLGGNLYGSGNVLLTGGSTITIPSGTTFNFLSIGGPLGGGQGFIGNISLVNLYESALNSTQLSVLSTAGAQGFFEKHSGTAFTQVGTAYPSLPSYWTGTIDTGLSYLDYADISGSSPTSVMASITAVEHGLYFADASGKLNFHDRSRRMGATSPVLTLPAGSYNVGLQPKINDQYLVNFASYQNLRGGTGVIAQNAASVDKYGTYPNGSVTSPQTAPYIAWGGGYNIHQVTTPATLTLAELYGSQDIGDAASWDVNTLAEPAMKLATPTVDILANLSGQNEYVAPSALFGVEINQVIAIGHNLDWWPNSPESSELFIEGVTESYSDTQATIGFYTSPAYQGRAWIPGDSTYGQIDVTARVGISHGQQLSPTSNPPVPTFSTSMNSGGGASGFVGAYDQLGLYGNLQQQVKPPLVFVSQTSVAQTLTNNSAAFITWDTTLIDTAQTVNQSADNGESYIIPVSGWYEVCATVNFASNGTNRRDIIIVQNQTGSLRNIAPASVRGTGTAPTGLSTSAVFWCNQGDAIAVQGYQDSGSSLNTSIANGGSHMSIRFLGSGSNRN